MVCPADRQAGRRQQPILYGPSSCSPYAERARKVPCRSCREERNLSGRAFAQRQAINLAVVGTKSLLRSAICIAYTIFSQLPPDDFLEGAQSLLTSCASVPWLFFFLFLSFFFSRARVLYRCYPLAIVVILAVNIVICERGAWCWCVYASGSCSWEPSVLGGREKINEK